MGASGGGVVLPGDPPPMTGAVLTNPTLTGTVTASGATFSGATFTGVTIATGTFTAGTISGATISGATFTGTSTGTLSISGMQTLLPTVTVTLTGSTGSDAATVSAAIAPAVLVLTGAASSGANLPTGPAGLVYIATNLVAGTVNVYCVGGTFDGVTGTTAIAITNTGNRGAVFACTTATGAWIRAIRST